MATNKKISDLTALTTPTTSDILTILDVSDTTDTNKQITLDNLKKVIGDVNGPASSTDNAIARWDSTTGELLQDSLTTVDNGGSINIPSGQTYKIDGTALAYSDITNAISTTEAKAIKLDDFSTPDDNTDLDATTSYHGLLPKLGGGTSNFLRADGTWVNPNAQSVELSLFTAKGDVVAATGSGAVDNVAVGTNDYSLVADSGESTGVKWADMSMVSDNGIITRASSTGSGTQDVTHGLGRTPKAIIFKAYYQSDPTVFSDGSVDDDLADKCIYQGVTDALATSSTYSIMIKSSGGPLWTYGTVTAWDSTDFTITWTDQGSGLAMFVHWIAFA